MLALTLERGPLLLALPRCRRRGQRRGVGAAACERADALERLRGRRRALAHDDGLGSVKSSTVDGVPGSSPPSTSAAQRLRGSRGHVVEPARHRGRRGGSRSSPRPRRRARAPRRRGRSSSGTRTPIVSGRVPAQPAESGRPGSAARACRGPAGARGRSRRSGRAARGRTRTAARRSSATQGDRLRRRRGPSAAPAAAPARGGRASCRGRRPCPSGARPACRRGSPRRRPRSRPPPLHDALPPGQIRRDRDVVVAELLEQRPRAPAAWPSPASSTSHPPGASSGRASRAIASPTPAPTSAARGSYSADLGLQRAPSPRRSTYGGFDTTRSNGPRTPASRSPCTSRTRPSTPARARFSLGERERGAPSCRRRAPARPGARPRSRARSRPSRRRRRGRAAPSSRRAAPGSARRRPPSPAAARARAGRSRASSRRKPHSPST